MKKSISRLLACSFVAIIISFVSFAQPANDDPSGAITLAHTNSTILTGNTTGATTSDIGVPQGLSRANSVWYKFTATSSEISILVEKISANDPAIRLFNNDFSLNVSRIRGASSFSRLKYDNLTIGENYYIMVDNNHGQPGEFRLTVKNFIDNDFIEGAIDFTNELIDGNHSSMAEEFSTYRKTSSVYLTSDVWFKFTGNEGNISIFTIAGTARAVNIKLFDSNDNELKSQDYKDGARSRLYYSGLNTGETYYFSVANSANYGTFSMNLSTNITNDHPIGAIQIPHIPEYHSGEAALNNIGTSGIHNFSCHNTNAGDSWYKFIATSETATIKVQSGGVLGSGTSFVASLLDQGLNEIACSFPTSNTLTELSLTNLNVGDTYFIAIASKAGGHRGTYTLSMNGGSESCTWTCDESGNMYYVAGKVGIATSTIPEDFSLAVGGNVLVEEIVVQMQQEWPDYVFDPSYNLPTLQETKKFILKNKHLKGIPSAKEVANNGINLGELNAKLLEKIEELTLYQIQLMELLQKLQLENSKQNMQIQKLTQKINQKSR